MGTLYEGISIFALMGNCIESGYGIINDYSRLIVLDAKGTGG
jgi:hypothetical protein